LNVQTTDEKYVQVIQRNFR